MSFADCTHNFVRHRRQNRSWLFSLRLRRRCTRCRCRCRCRRRRRRHRRRCHLRVRIRIRLRRRIFTQIRRRFATRTRIVITGAAATDVQTVVTCDRSTKKLRNFAVFVSSCTVRPTHSPLTSQYSSVVAALASSWPEPLVLKHDRASLYVFNKFFYNKTRVHAANLYSRVK